MNTQPRHRSRRRRIVFTAFSLWLSVAMLGFRSYAPAAHAVVGPVGQGFTVTAADLRFILAQIKIAESHVANTTSLTGPCGALLNKPNDGIADVDQVPDVLTSYGLRTVDGSCNNLVAGRERYAASDEVFPRLTSPKFRTAENTPPGFPAGNGTPTTYAQPGNTYDTQPRIISNLIVDQTSTNPAAIAAAMFPVRSQGNPGLFPCTTDPDPLADPPVDAVPANCVPSHKTLFIPNVTTDVGLSPPFNSMFTFFGQFFDHGVDQTVKTGANSFVPLRPDDPLITLGPDGKANTGDEVTNPALQFMVITRTQVEAGPDGVLGTADDGASNTDTPLVDQSQTYTSHASHQVFLREYALDANNRPHSTGKLLGGLPAGQTYAGSPDGTGGIGTWKATKQQAAQKLGLLLQDKDVTNIPMLAVDPYGNFLPGPARGLPQYVTATGLVEGNIAAPVPVPANVVYFDTPFLTDIAHSADPSPVDTDHDSTTAPVAPQPDTNLTAGTQLQVPVCATSGPCYDNELLDAHFVCGDGRCNENIALSAVHQIFHSEHDRLVDYYDGPGGVLHQPGNEQLLADFQAPHVVSVNGTDKDISFGYGGRLFQAARFVTEMEYQHLVFEEFARKLVPAIRPFHVYHADGNPVVPAEFAHAVYRFGHSMLDDVVARTNPDGSNNDITLLNGFLNPPGYFNGGSFGTLTAEQAAGSIFMGSSDQVGNEIDEFVTETLRNNLLGLPLDLPTINMTRARDAGVPPLNDVRRQIYAQTNDSALKPYDNWADFGQHLKHPESLINFVAAYGTHPSITSATTVAAKRAAARAIVDPVPQGSPINPAGDVPPPDSGAFLFGSVYPGPDGDPNTTADNIDWSNDANGVTITGVDSIDLWVGGLAEVTNLFGGLLGSTFNYVFQTTLEGLQENDRLYYLARTPGMNLRTQLEGNSFAEMVTRNTDGTNTLKADVFATADCKFQLGNITWPYDGSTTSSMPGLSPLSGAGSVNDDLSTPDCDENQLLLRQTDGTIAYRQRNNIDPTGINGQAVYNGTNGADRVNGGNDNDTVWGSPGNDVIDGQGGDDNVLGGEGNDRIIDFDGADIPEGGPGNDAIDAGPGDDLSLGGDGNDFINGGLNDNEAFAGEGTDFVIAGAGADAVFGDGGDDWIQGGSGQDLLIGDHGAPFFDDPGQTKPGNDVFVGQIGENDYDAEGGDDLMAANAAIDRDAGAGGFDWNFHQYNTIAADDDMKINQLLVGVPIQLVVNRDRWQETEGDSGADRNDVIRGDDDVPVTIGGAGFAGCDALDQAGLDRIPGLDTIVPPLNTPASAVAALSATGFCPLSGNVWGDGNILIGGLGSDTIEGRGADDIIDGDRYLTVAISVRTDPADPNTEIGRTDLMEHQATSGTFGAGTTGKTLQQAVFAGLVDPGNLVAVRQIVTPTAAQLTADLLGNVDTAVFSGPLANYTISAVGDHLVVTDTTGTDGTDTVYNVEQLKFVDATIPATGPATAPAATLSAASATFGSAGTGTTTAPQTITVTNTGDGTLTVSNVSLTGVDATQFSQTNTCVGTPVAPAGTCSIAITFSPTSAGAKTASVSIASNAAGSPTLVGVTGTGVASAPVAGISPASLGFGSVATGTNSATQNITVSNTGNANLTVSGATIGGADAAQFGIVTNGCATVAPAGSCTITVRFNPTTTGAKSASVSIAHNAAGSPGTVALTGTGTAPVATITPTSLTFASTPIGNASAAQTVTISNTGTGNLVISGATLGGTNASSFTRTTSCTTIAPGGSCTVAVTFTPQSPTGAKTATLSIAHNAAGSPTVINLSGTATAGATVSVGATFAFGATRQNTSTTKTITVTNTGAVALNVTAVSTTGATFSATRGTCTTPIATNRTCKLNVTFTPTAIQAFTGSLTITSNATNSPTTVSLSGSGKR